MEYILLIVIIVLLILQNTKNTKNNTSLEREINKLNEKLNSLYSLIKTQQIPKTVEDKSAKAIMKIEVEKPSEVPVKAIPSANLEAIEEDYTPSYPKVISLSDKNASTIKDILRIAESTKDYSTLIKLRHKIVEALEINKVKEKSDIEFIRTLLEDYNYYTQKQLIVTRPIPLDTKEEKPIEPVKVVASKKTVMTAKPIEKVVHEPTLSIWEKFKQRNPDLEKFIGENLINKIGILILVLGISYFVKYAIDKDWINEPARVGTGVLAGSLVLFIAHKLRQKYASFS